MQPWQGRHPDRVPARVPSGDRSPSQGVRGFVQGLFGCKVRTGLRRLDGHATRTALRSRHPAPSCSAAAAASTTSVVVACSTYADFSGQSAGSLDFAAVMLNSTNGSEIWRWQGGTDAADKLSAVTVVEDGPIVLAGYTTGDWATSNLGMEDFAAVTLSLDGDEISRFQGGTAEEDVFEAVERTSNNTVVFAGHTGGSWNGTNVGGKDFVAVKTLDFFSTTEGASADGESSSQKVTTLLVSGLSILAAIVLLTVWGFVTRRPAAQRIADNPPTPGGQNGDPENVCPSLEVAQ